MKRFRAVVNNNDRIVINIKDYNTIEYKLIEARTGKECHLKDIEFSLSVKKYFGGRGKTIRELYAFDQWHNKKLEKEISRIWRLLEGKDREVLSYQKKKVVSESFYDERCA